MDWFEALSLLLGTIVFLMAIVIVCLGIAPPSFATELEVTHWWTSGGEAKAVKVFADAFDATGNKWKDAAIGGVGYVDIVSAPLRIKNREDDAPGHARLAAGQELVARGIFR